MEDDPDFDDRVEEDQYASGSEVMEHDPMITGEEYSNRDHYQNDEQQMPSSPFPM
jgi:hypothetical protein